MKKRIIALILGISCVWTNEAQALKALRDICPKGSKMVVESSYVVEGVVISDWRSQNMDMNISMTSARLETRESGRTASHDSRGKIPASPEDPPGVRFDFQIVPCYHLKCSCMEQSMAARRKKEQKRAWRPIDLHAEIIACWFYGRP